MIDRIRRVAIIVAVWGSWSGSMALGIWSVVDYDPNHGDFAPQWVGLAFIFLIGVAIAATSARARQKLSDQIVAAFKIGLDNGQELRRTVHEHSPKHPRSTEDSGHSAGS
jgi:hypothetical protein